MKRNGKILRDIFAGLSVLLVVVTCIMLEWTWRQERLDDVLFQALRRRDLTATRTALHQVANPNAMYEIRSANEASSDFTSFVVKLWNRLKHHPSGKAKYAALLVPISPYPSDYPRVVPLLTVLVQHGADPNVADAYGTTPLLYAAAAMGRVRTPAKIQAARETAAARRGIPLTEEHREKIRQAQAARWEKVRAEKAAMAADAPPKEKKRWGDRLSRIIRMQGQPRNVVEGDRRSRTWKHRRKAIRRLFCALGRESRPYVWSQTEGQTTDE
jgi:hypothetical protein